MTSLKVLLASKPRAVTQKSMACHRSRNYHGYLYGMATRDYRNSEFFSTSFFFSNKNNAIHMFYWAEPCFIIIFPHDDILFFQLSKKKKNILNHFNFKEKKRKYWTNICIVKNAKIIYFIFDIGECGIIGPDGVSWPLASFSDKWLSTCCLI